MDMVLKVTMSVIILLGNYQLLFWRRYTVVMVISTWLKYWKSLLTKYTNRLKNMQISQESLIVLFLDLLVRLLSLTLNHADYGLRTLETRGLSYVWRNPGNTKLRKSLWTTKQTCRENSAALNQWEVKCAKSRVTFRTEFKWRTKDSLVWQWAEHSATW